MLFLISFFSVSDTFYLSRALGLYGLTIQDLGFRKDRSEDTRYKPPGLLKIFRNPLWSEELARNLRNGKPIFRVERILNDYFSLGITGPYTAIKKGNVQISVIYPEITDSTDTSTVVPFDSSIIRLFENLILSIDVWNFYRNNALGTIGERSIGKLKTFLANYIMEDSSSVIRFLHDHGLEYYPFDEDSIFVILDSLRLRDFYFSDMLLINTLMEIRDSLMRRGGLPVMHLGTPYGRIVLDSVPPSDTFLLFVDIEGDDKYTNLPCGRICAVIDLEGDDRYMNGEFLAFDGIRFLYDGGGNDRYERVNFFGGSLLGAAYVEDAGGDDFYDVGRFSLGASIMGFSIFRDGGGDDIYRGVNSDFAFSGLLGVADFVDVDGNDVYILGRYEEHKPLWRNEYIGMGLGFSTGYRIPLGGGFSIFQDRKGNDRYSCGTYCLGSGYWYATGLFLDESGNDRYTGTEYGVGSGIHLSAGLFFDLSGDDIYVFRAGPSLGSGHDWAFGMLYEGAGNDIYNVSGGLGNSLYNALGIFIDASGNDSYSVSEKDLSCGQAMESRRAREYMGIGVFVDVRGKDNYPSGVPCRSDSYWRSGDIGIGFDGK